MIQYGEILELLRLRFSLRLSILKNLATITYAFLRLSSGGRSGNGRLSLSAIARSLYAEGLQKSRFKRLSRFLSNRLFTPEVMIPDIVRFVFGGMGGEMFIPVVVDQTTIGGVQVLMAGILFSGRVLPIGFSCFVYEKIKRSQNILETGFLELISGSFPLGKLPVFIMDRGYGRLQLINALNIIAVPYIIRLRSNVIVWLKGKAIALSRLRYKEGRAIRYSRVLYRKDRAEVVDLIIYRGRGFKEVWYLVVPSWWDLPADEVVELYRERMQIEQGFRDWKTHLGVRGLKLKVNRDERLNRLLLSLSIAYILLLLLGISSFASKVRRRFESPRRKPRHGTVNTLSVFTLAIAMLSAIEIFDDVIKQLTEIINALKVKSALSLISAKA